MTAMARWRSSKARCASFAFSQIGLGRWGHVTATTAMYDTAAGSIRAATSCAAAKPSSDPSVKKIRRMLVDVDHIAVDADRIGWHRRHGRQPDARTGCDVKARTMPRTLDLSPQRSP